MKEKTVTPRAKSAAVTTPDPQRPKRLTYMEQRELEQMEERITAAEEELHTFQRQMEDPAVLRDRHRLHEVCENVDRAQKKVSELYQRWESLETRKTG